MRVVAGKYALIKKLGQGGFGAVYLVKHLQLDILYALKVIKSDKASDENLMARFKREAQVLSRLLHKNSIPLRDFGQTAQGNLYMAMDFCRGKSLRQILAEKGALSASQVVKIMLQILSVMIEAHNLGIIHRDIKPDNIMLETTKEGKTVVKVLDFGMAKLVQGLVGSSFKTQSGKVVGTPLYMSPEQALSEKIDHRSDIYSLGLVMYETVTGHPPYPRDGNEVQTMMKQINDYPPPFSKVAPQLKIPQILEKVVRKAIAKKPEDRFQSAREFLNYIKRLATNHQFSSGVRSGPLSISSPSSHRADSQVQTGAITTGRNLSLRKKKNISSPLSSQPESTGGERSFFKVFLGVSFVFIAFLSALIYFLLTMDQKGTVVKEDLSPKAAFKIHWSDAQTAFKKEDYEGVLSKIKKAEKHGTSRELKILKSTAQGLLYKRQARQFLEKGNFQRATQKLETALELPHLKEKSREEFQSSRNQIKKYLSTFSPSISQGPFLVKVHSNGKIALQREGNTQIYSSLQELVKSLKKGTRLVLAPGKYEANLEINIPLHIMGMGEREKVRIESSRGDGIVLKSAYARFEGVTIASGVKSFATSHAALEQKKGELYLYNCFMEVRNEDGLEIEEASKKTEVVGCKISLFFASGIKVTGPSKLIVKKTEIFNPILSRKEFSGLKLNGVREKIKSMDQIDGRIHVAEMARKKLNERNFGIWLQPGHRGSAQIEDVNIHHNQRGIFIQGKVLGKTKITRSQITDNFGTGILLESVTGRTRRGKMKTQIWRSVQIENCDILRNRKEGIQAKKGVGLTLIDCNVKSNGEEGIDLFVIRNFRMKDCKVTMNREVGIKINTSRGILHQCLSANNLKSGLLLDNEKLGKKIERIIKGQAKNSNLLDDTRVVFKECNFSNNGKAGIEIKVGSASIFLNCKVNDNDGQGLVFTMFPLFARNHKLSPAFKNCEFRNNENHGLEVTNGGPHFEACIIENNGVNGIYSINSNIKLKNCLIGKNKSLEIEGLKSSHIDLYTVKIGEKKRPFTHIRDFKRITKDSSSIIHRK